MAVIFGLSGPRLSPSESAFFRDVNPWGFILFTRNIETPDQVKRLTSDLRDCVERDCLIFIDQEGGRVQRLKPPHWPVYPPAADLGEVYAQNPDLGLRAAYLNYRLIADDLRSVGINANCAPVLDIPVKAADPIISDRAYGAKPDAVIDMGHAAMAGLTAGGVAPVIKHMPGHGRAKVDSHKALPRIKTSRQTLEKTDYRPFKAFKDAPMAMTAHAVYEYADAKTPITISRKAMQSVIRDDIGYDGLVMTDDLDMRALSGGLENLTTRALKAGCDIALQCSGKMASMVNVAKGARMLMEDAKRRADVAVYSTQFGMEFDRNAALSEYHAIMPRKRLVA